MGAAVLHGGEDVLDLVVQVDSVERADAFVWDGFVVAVVVGVEDVLEVQVTDQVPLVIGDGEPAEPGSGDEPCA